MKLKYIDEVEKIRLNGHYPGSGSSNNKLLHIFSMYNKINYKIFVYSRKMQSNFG